MGPGFDSQPPFGSGIDPIPGSGMAGDPLTGQAQNQDMLWGSRRRGSGSGRHSKLAITLFLLCVAIFAAVAVFLAIQFTSNHSLKSFSEQSFPRLNPPPAQP
jgi:hypothetical protein